jgi:Uri superfamily endonuclease
MPRSVLAVSLTRQGLTLHASKPCPARTPSSVVNDGCRNPGRTAWQPPPPTGSLRLRWQRARAGGVRGRLAHHMRIAGCPHWHIDYLRRHTTLEEIWFSYLSEVAEPTMSRSGAQKGHAGKFTTSFSTLFSQRLFSCSKKLHLNTSVRAFQLRHSSSRPRIVR